jgi:hypothetical protein
VDNNGTVIGVATGVAIVEAAQRGAVRPRCRCPQHESGAGAAARPARRRRGGAAADPFAGQPRHLTRRRAPASTRPRSTCWPSENTRIYPRALRDDGSPAAPVQVT